MYGADDPQTDAQHQEGGARKRVSNRYSNGTSNQQAGADVSQYLDSAVSRPDLLEAQTNP